MDLTLPEPRDSDARAQRADLSAALEGVTAAINRADIPDALRHADRARRLAPLSAEIAVLFASLAVRHGFAKQALAALDACRADEPGPRFEATRVDALLALGRNEDASTALIAALRRYAVDPAGDLAAAASRTAAAMGAAGWVGIAPDFAMIGALSASDVPALIELRVAERVVATETVAPAAEPRPFRLAGGGLAGRGELRADGAELLGGEFSLPADLRPDGRTTCDGATISGWLKLGWDPDWSGEVVFSATGKEPIRLATLPDTTVEGRRVFVFLWRRSRCSAIGSTLRRRGPAERCCRYPTARS